MEFIDVSAKTIEDAIAKGVAQLAAEGQELVETKVLEQPSNGFLGIGMSVWSPMILTEFLFAPTVPSPPRPQNLHSLVPAAAVMGAGLTSGRDRKVTSSVIPRVKRSLG